MSELMDGWNFPQLHRLKLQKCFCNPVANGVKTFEIRKNDRGFQKGDHIQFVPVDSNGTLIYHPICEEEFEITYCLNGYGLENGYVVLAIKKVV